MRPERLRKSDVRLLCTLERNNAERPLAFTVQAAAVPGELGKTRSELSRLTSIQPSEHNSLGSASNRINSSRPAR